MLVIQLRAERPRRRDISAIRLSAFVQGSVVDFLAEIALVRSACNENDINVAIAV